MRETYDPQLKARLTLDEKQRVRGINHVDEFWMAGENAPRKAALSYMREISGTLGVPAARFDFAHQPVSFLDPRPQETQYRLSEEKSYFDSTTEGFYQTHLNVPVWGAGVTVTLKQNPTRVVSAVNTSLEDVNAELPSDEVVGRWREVLERPEPRRRRRADAGFTGDEQQRRKKEKSSEEAEDGEETETGSFIGDLLSGYAFRRSTARAAVEARERAKNARLLSGRFFIYRYDPEDRLPRQPEAEGEEDGDVKKKRDESPFLAETEPTLPLPPVDDRIEEGQDYLVAEIVFFHSTPEWGDINWRALVELETASVLYLRGLAAHVDGRVFHDDPISASGNAANDPSSNSATLNPFRDDVVLPNLDAPVGGTQSLSGGWVALSDEESPTVEGPTEPTGTDFDYDARTNDFAGVNAYYHANRFFDLVEDLGFTISTYFGGTTFPVPVDHRGLGTAINAHCVGTGSGIDHLCYALADTSNTTNPIGIATDWRVHLHELGGHGILHDHVGGPNFGFAHSAGDSMAVILADPESQAPDRFLLAPFVPAVVRRHDRPVSSWAWNGPNDVGGYSSEQILSTTLFRIYRSIGGDSGALSRREFAARYMAYLILRSVSTLTPSTNPANPDSFANTLMATDLLNWTSEGVDGGAYGKVIRWAFEKQGLYQPGSPSSGSVTTEGDPPAVDVYIDDGRAGEYEYLANHWSTTTIWNRLAADGGTTHQPPVIGSTNYAYVKIKNRGTQQAQNVVVRGYHTRPGAGLLWPDDFEAFTTAQLSAGTLNANDSQEKVVGPFEWTPNINAYGHDCMLMIVSATSDPSNIDNFTAGEVIPEWRLVPNDNNVGQRNVNPVPGGGGGGGLVASLQGFPFWIGNPNPRRAVIDVVVELPEVLSQRGWQLGFQGLRTNRFTLDSRERRELTLELRPGADFDQADIQAASDRDIVLTARADGAVIGGMVYRLDPDTTEAVNLPGRPGAPKDRCREHADRLLECLDLHGQNVCKVRVKKVTLDVVMEGDDCC